MGIADHILPLGDLFLYIVLMLVTCTQPFWAAAPKGMMSYSTQGDFRSFVRLFVHLFVRSFACLFIRPPPSAWPEICPLRPEI